MAHSTCGAFVRRTLLAASAVILGVTAAQAAGGYEKHVTRQSWTFAGIFGQYDQGQLQRGLQVYREACGVCHSMQLVPFRTLTHETGPNLSIEAAEQIASEYTITDISNETGRPFERPAVLTDRFPPPYPNPTAAAAANNGAYPPDFSLIAKARAEARGFPNWVFDMFGNYAEHGPDYIYALLTGYKDPPEGEEGRPGQWYNPPFLAGDWISMPQPLRDGQISYADGSPETMEQYAADVSAFLMWAAEPTLEQRKELGFRVMIFLIVLTILFYLVKKKLWRNVEH
ncbi:MAG: cytochrome c1 [Pseudomonadota bacterium]